MHIPLLSLSLFLYYCLSLSDTTHTRNHTPQYCKPAFAVGCLSNRSRAGVLEGPAASVSSQRGRLVPKGTLLIPGTVDRETRNPLMLSLSFAMHLSYPLLQPCKGSLFCPLAHSRHRPQDKYRSGLPPQSGLPVFIYLAHCFIQRNCIVYSLLYPKQLTNED